MFETVQPQMPLQCQDISEAVMPNLAQALDGPMRLGLCSMVEPYILEHSSIDELTSVQTSTDVDQIYFDWAESSWDFLSWEGDCG